MVKVFMFVMIGSILLPIIFNRPERKPGNLAPIQLISALGAWALILANVSAIAIAIRESSLLLFCTAAATLTVALISFLRDYAANVSDRMPESVKLVVDDLKQLLGGAPRLGVASLEAIIVQGRCPGIGVAVARQGRVIVRVRRDVALWLERHQRSGEARAELAASFVRFTVLHELAHVLNGDHRTFRFVRSVAIGNLVWLAGGLAAAESLLLNDAASITPLAVSALIILLLIAQSLVARRFITEREILADWRAVQTLPPSDAARLLERRGRRRGVSNPTELEKLMTDLNVQTPPHHGREPLSHLIRLAWPAGDDIHHRAERAGGDRLGDEPRPVLWAALMGMQCGALSMSVSVAMIFAVTPWIAASPDIILTGMLAIMALISAPASVSCELRVDPARMRMRKVKYTRTRIFVGVAFYLAFIAATITLYCFQIPLNLVALPAAFFVVGVVIALAGVVSIGVWVSGMSGIHDGGGELRMTPRSSWVVVFPLVAGMGSVLIPLSLIASRWLDAGTFLNGRWVPLAMMSFAGFVVSTSMARSTSSVLRVIAPMAFLDTPSPVYGFRVFWCDFYIDLSRMTLARAAAVAMAVQIVALPFFVLVSTLLMQGMRSVFAPDTVLAITFFGSFGMMALNLVIPDRFRAYEGPSARLLDTGRLHIFESLLAAARTADPAAADRLQASIGRWLRNDRFPDALLPEPRSVWPLAPLLSLMRLARETGERTALERWRDPIEHALRQIISNDAVSVAPRQSPSMHWTTLAATVIDEAELRDAFPFQGMLDRIETMLDERLEHGTTNLLADLIAGYKLLRRHGRPGPTPERIRRFVRASALVARPGLRQSLAELCVLADLTADAELKDRLATTIRFRFWEALQLNPRKDVLLLLDCYLAAAHLGEMDSRHGAAVVLIGELSNSVADELMVVLNAGGGA